MGTRSSSTKNVISSVPILVTWEYLGNISWKCAMGSCFASSTLSAQPGVCCSGGVYIGLYCLSGVSVDVTGTSLIGEAIEPLPMVTEQLPANPASNRNASTAPQVGWPNISKQWGFSRPLQTLGTLKHSEQPIAGHVGSSDFKESSARYILLLLVSGWWACVKVHAEIRL